MFLSIKQKQTVTTNERLYWYIAVYANDVMVWGDSFVSQNGSGTPKT